MTPHHRAGKAFDVGLPLAFIAIGAVGAFWAPLCFVLCAYGVAMLITR